MNKTAVHLLMLEKLEIDLDVLQRAAQTAYEAATHAEGQGGDGLVCTIIQAVQLHGQVVDVGGLEAITRDSKKSGTTGDDIDLALLVDGLQAEREQGITIDVAYLYFSTAKRKFIIADTPGHEQYTRNMATGASTCDLAIILWMPVTACRPRPVATAISPRCWASSTS